MAIAKQSLEKYRKKRTFSKTPEPSDGVSSGGRIYVVQKHDATRLHYDFRLEHNGVLLSWAVPKEPSTDPKVKRLAVHVEDHPVSYATFAGTIPKGNYGAGTVEIWDHGTWTPATDVDKGLRDGEIKFAVHGERLNGRWVLVRMGPASEKENWLLIKERDDAPLEEAIKPVKWRGALPSHQLCELKSSLPSGENWRYELKWDGYRAFVVVENGEAKIFSRNKNDLGLKNLAKKVADVISTDGIIDGELVALNNEGRSDFGLLQSLLESESDQIRFVAFDLLKLGDLDLRPLPLSKRLGFLERVIDPSKNQNVMLSPPLVGGPNSILSTACQLGFEGIVAKKLSSHYSGTRSSDWLKVKCRRTGVATVIGFTKLQGSSNAIGALIVGEVSKSGLRYMGRVGTGFNHEEREKLYSKLSPMEDAKPDLPNLTSIQTKGVTWVKPILKVKFEYAELTNEGILRQASYQGSSQTKEIKEAEEKPVPPKTTIKLTHPGRIIDPESGATKQDVSDYYQEFGTLIMPYLKDRLVSIVRCPDGVPGECFYQKHLMAGKYKGIKEISDDDDLFITIQSEIGLLEACQMGGLEFHPWGSRIKEIEKPDMIIFDLDPSAEVPWKQVLDGASFVRKRLQSIGLEPFVRLSGGKGVHLVLSLKPELEWPAIKSFCKSFADQMTSEEPDLFLSKASKDQRKGKIYVDYLRNGRGATAVAPYCLRSRPGLPVVMPLTWEEFLKTESSGQFTMAKAREHLSKRKQNPWASFEKEAVSLKKILGI